LAVFVDLILVVVGQAAGMGRHSPGHVHWRPSQQHSHGNRSCSQPCRHQQDQQIQPTIYNSHLHSSGHWNSRYVAPPGSWAGPGTGKAGDHNHRRLQRDHLPVPAVISGSAKREVTRSQLAILLQPVIHFFLTLVLNAYDSVLVGQYNDNKLIDKAEQGHNFRDA